MLPRDPRSSGVFVFASQVDNIIVVTDHYLCGDVEWTINMYRKEINDDALVVQIFLAQK